MVRKMYHTQEKWAERLVAPVICTRKDAWLGEGFYFWGLLQDARIWGRTSKTATGAFEIYAADVDCNDVLDTVFNEEQYEWWLAEIERVAKMLQGKSSGAKKPTKWQVNQYIREKRIWEKADVAGILFENLTLNPDRSRIDEFHYKKRIQLVAFEPRVISGFVFHAEQLLAKP